MSDSPENRIIAPSPLTLMADPVTEAASRQLENVRALITAEAELKAEIRARQLRLEQLRKDKRRHCSIVADIDKEIEGHEQFLSRKH